MNTPWMSIGYKFTSHDPLDLLSTLRRLTRDKNLSNHEPYSLCESLCLNMLVVGTSQDRNMFLSHPKNIGTMVVFEFETYFVLSRFFWFGSPDLTNELAITETRVEALNYNPENVISGLNLLCNITVRNKHLVQLPESLQSLFAKSLFKLRHDLIVFGVSKTLNIPYEQEKPMSLIVPNIDPRSRNKTPDIVIRDDMYIFIVEVTVTATPNLSEKKKEKKYQPLIEDLTALGYRCDLCVISASPNFSGLNLKISRLLKQASNVSETISIITNLNNSLTDKIKLVAPIFKADLDENNVAEETGFLRDIENLTVPLTQDAAHMEARCNIAKLSEQHYLGCLDDLFNEDKFKLTKDMPEYAKKMVPEHCDVVDILNLSISVPQGIEANYDRLEDIAPSLHFAFPPEHFVFPEGHSKLSEEILALKLLRELTSIPIKTTGIPAFDFLAELADQAATLESIDDAKNVFVNGYLNDKHKKLIKTFKSMQEQQYISVKIEKKTLNKTFRVLTPEEAKLENEVREELVRQKAENEKKSRPLEDKTKIHYKKRKISAADYTENIKEFNSHTYLLSTASPQVLELTQYHKALFKKVFSSELAGKFLEEAKIGFKKELRPPERLSGNNKSKSIVPVVEDYLVVVDFLAHLSTKTTKSHIPSPDFLFSSETCLDDHNIMKLKEQIHKESNPILLTLLNTQAAQYAYRLHLFAQQVIHLGSFSNRLNQFSIVTTGLSNMALIVAGTKHKPSTDPGVPFLCFGIIPHKERLSPVYGKVFYFDHGDKTVFITNWRRLKLEKITHIRDVFFSTLATAFKNLCTFSTVDSKMLTEFYSSRVLFGLTVSQKVAEFLSDFKYIAMASLSEFSKTDKLILDKIKGPFTKHIEVFLFFQLINNSIKTILHLKDHPVRISEFAEIYLDKELTDMSIGGQISLPYIWSKFGFHDNFHNYLDSVHAYTHTIKEPASYFHESIKSLKTIIKFNDLYHNMSVDQRFGAESTKTDVENLIRNNTMGFSARFLSDAFNFFHSRTKIDYKSLLFEKKFREPIAHFASTKAGIEDPEREEESTARLKVIDAMLCNTAASLHNFDLSKNLFEHAANVVSQSNLKPLVDMCIKVQYGPKREFYVLDVHFKFALKFLEEFFKSACQQIPTECISVPGDLKLLKIQELNRKIRIGASRDKLQQYYVNGDCSKWSASELMESFAVIITELKKYIPINVYNIFMDILSLWTQKRLQIDPHLFGELTETAHTKSLFKDGKRINHLVLPQNFLMGLFNYLSSFKASVIFTYTKHLVQEKLPKIVLKHLEHSDDFTWGILCEEGQIVQLKVFMTICMRLGSITDSDKKTVISNWYQEFVSLFTFNGLMMYPQIKKVKEITSAITGMGYYQDVASIGSRVAEVMRCGCTNQVGLIFLKIHNWLVSNLYSLSKNMRNDNYRRHNISPFSVPVQAFGLTECWPLLYLISDGDANNYRIAKFYDNKRLLFELSDKRNTNIDQQIEGSITLYSPDFLKKFRSVRLNKVKKLIGFNQLEAQQFYTEHPSYKYIKPNYKPLLVGFLKSFYLLRTFAQAYMRNSKLATLLRISGYTKKKCIDYKLDTNLYSISELLDKFIGIYNTETNVVDDLDPKLMTEGSLAPILFYEIFYSSKVKMSSQSRNNYKTVAALMPKPYQQVTIDNDPAHVIQYFFNNNDYILDKRQPKPGSSIEDDAEVIKLLNDTLTNFSLNERVNYIYNYLSKERKRTRVCMAPSLDQRDIIKFVIENCRFALSTFSTSKVKLINEIKFDGPLGVTPINFHFQGKTMTKIHAVCRTIFTLVTFIRLKTQKPQDPDQIAHNLLSNLMMSDSHQTLMEVVRTLSLEQMDVNGLTPNDIQSMLVLKALFCNDFTVASAYSKQFTSIVYKYDTPANFTQGKYKGDSIVSFSCFDCNAKMFHKDSDKKKILATNTNNIARVFMCFNIGLQFVDSKEIRKWESTKIAAKINDNVTTRQELLKRLEFLFGISLYTQAFRRGWKILCNDSNGLFWVLFTRQLMVRKDVTILPILYIPELLSGGLDDARQQVMMTHLALDRTKLQITTQNGNWKIARFCPNVLYSNTEVISNAKDFYFGNIRIDTLLKNSNIYETYFGGNLSNQATETFLKTTDYTNLPEIDVLDRSRVVSILSKINGLKNMLPNLEEAWYKHEFPAVEETIPEVKQTAEQIRVLGKIAYTNQADFQKLWKAEVDVTDFELGEELSDEEDKLVEKGRGVWLKDFAKRKLLNANEVIQSEKLTKNLKGITDQVENIELRISQILTEASNGDKDPMLTKERISSLKDKLTELKEGKRSIQGALDDLHFGLKEEKPESAVPDFTIPPDVDLEWVVGELNENLPPEPTDIGPFEFVLADALTEPMMLAEPLISEPDLSFLPELKDARSEFNDKLEIINGCVSEILTQFEIYKVPLQIYVEQLEKGVLFQDTRFKDEIETLKQQLNACQKIKEEDKSRFEEMLSAMTPIRRQISLKEDLLKISDQIFKTISDKKAQIIKECDYKVSTRDQLLQEGLQRELGELLEIKENRVGEPIWYISLAQLGHVQKAIKDHLDAIEKAGIEAKTTGLTIRNKHVLEYYQQLLKPLPEDLASQMIHLVNIAKSENLLKEKKVKLLEKSIDILLSPSTHEFFFKFDGLLANENQLFGYCEHLLLKEKGFTKEFEKQLASVRITLPELEIKVDDSEYQFLTTVITDSNSNVKELTNLLTANERFVLLNKPTLQELVESVRKVEPTLVRLISRGFKDADITITAFTHKFVAFCEKECSDLFYKDEVDSMIDKTMENLKGTVLFQTKLPLLKALRDLNWVKPTIFVKHEFEFQNSKTEALRQKIDKFNETHLDTEFVANVCNLVLNKIHNLPKEPEKEKAFEVKLTEDAALIQLNKIFKRLDEIEGEKKVPLALMSDRPDVQKMVAEENDKIYEINDNLELETRTLLSKLNNINMQFPGVGSFFYPEEDDAKKVLMKGVAVDLEGFIPEKSAAPLAVPNVKLNATFSLNAKFEENSTLKRWSRQIKNETAVWEDFTRKANIISFANSNNRKILTLLIGMIGVHKADKIAKLEPKHQFAYRAVQDFLCQNDVGEGVETFPIRIGLAITGTKSIDWKLWRYKLSDKLITSRQFVYLGNDNNSLSFVYAKPINDYEDDVLFALDAGVTEEEIKMMTGIPKGTLVNEMLMLLLN
jgi:hypothetical protein